MTGPVPSAVERAGYEQLSSTLVGNETLELQARGEDLAAIVRMLPLRGARRVLDVGCGTGALTRAIARHAGPGVETWGIDPTEDHVTRARAIAAADGLVNTKFIVGDVFDAPGDLRGSFDLVCEKYVLMSMLPRDVGRSFVSALCSLATTGGSVALIEADIDFGHDRHPPAPEPLATVLPRIVSHYREHDLIEWRCGLHTYEYLRHARLGDISVRVADGRVIQGGMPRELVEHGNTDVEALIAPCLEELGLSQVADRVARQWREYLESDAHLIYHPIFIATGRVHDDRQHFSRRTRQQYARSRGNAID